MTISARFPPRARLRSAREFQAALKTGVRVQERAFSAAVIANQEGHARLGLAISKKMAARAVDRNRIKRAVRESFRQHQNTLPVADIVIFARGPCLGLPAAERRASLEHLWRRIRERWSHG